MTPYPFSAVVGMERAKHSLMLHAVDPRIGGCLLLGHRGCAKSTLVRGFAAVMPPLPGGRPVPFVEVPLGVSEDRLLGSLHAEALLEAGQWRERVGLLGAAHEGVLYIDEINLLPDPIADLLLDSAASGVHRLERDGFSRATPANYILVGTMNPEEGELRPQLLDRFAHGVFIEDAFTAAQRVEIGRRSIAFEDDPAAFLQEWAQQSAQLAQHLARARARLREVLIADSLRFALAERARAEALEGMRAELAILRTARACAALRDAAAVSAEDLEVAWDLCLGHRRPLQDHPGKPPFAPSPERLSSQQSSSVSTPTPLGESPSFSMQNCPVSAPATDLSQPPKEAHPGAIPLAAARKPKVLALPQPLYGARHLTARLASGKHATTRLATSRLDGGRIRWQASLLASLQAGWRPRASGWRIVLSHKGRVVPRLWLLLDASRSGGARQFLAGARDILLERIRSSVRVSALLLRSGALSWMVRNAPASTARRKLEVLPDASGKSPLTRALQLLRRAVLGARPAPEDALFVCSDGLPTLEPGQGSTEAAARLRAALRRLATQFPGELMWVGPEKRRAWDGWLEQLLANSRVGLVRVPSPETQIPS